MHNGCCNFRQKETQKQWTKTAGTDFSHSQQYIYLYFLFTSSTFILAVSTMAQMLLSDLFLPTSTQFRCPYLTS